MKLSLKKLVRYYFEIVNKNQYLLIAPFYLKVIILINLEITLL